MRQLAMFEDPRRATGGDFEEWWALYVHKVGKGAARQAYRKAAGKADRLVLLEGVRRYVAAKPADRPWCNPSTWLNQERWLDEPAGPMNARLISDDERELALLRKRAELMARGINVASVTRRHVEIMLARGWLTAEQARRAGW